MPKIVLPDLGEGIQDATIACWHFQQGDRVNANADVVELVTDKASFNVPAGSSGILKQVFYKEGDRVKIGEILAMIEDR